MTEPTAQMSASQGCRAREILSLVADKWSLGVVDTLSSGPRRFSELNRSITGISKKMLTATLRGLEREGIVKRTVCSVMPPNVTYELTSMGRTFMDATVPLVRWGLQNIAAIDEARAEFDKRGSETYVTRR